MTTLSSIIGEEELKERWPATKTTSTKKRDQTERQLSKDPRRY